MAMDGPRPTPLQQQIDEFIAEGASWLPPELFRALLRPIGQRVHTGTGSRTLQEGVWVADFTLPDAGGEAVRLAHLLRQGSVVLTFFGGAWCPYSHLALRAYQLALPQLQAAGATLLAISPQTPDHSRVLAAKLRLTFPLLSDAGNHVARRLGLVITIDETVRGAYRRLDADLPTFNGDASWELPRAGTLLLASSGIIRLAFVDPDFTRRLDPSILITRLNALNG